MNEFPSGGRVRWLWTSAARRGRDSRVGPHVTLGPGVRIENCELSDCIVGRGSELLDCRLELSLVGEECQVKKLAGTVNIGDYCRVIGPS